MQTTSYPVKRLYAQLAKLRAKQTVVILDACFSGLGGRSVLAPGIRPLVTKGESLEPPRALTVLAASGGDQVAGALDEQAHGLFTYYLLKGLLLGHRTAGSLQGYLKPMVQAEARRQNRLQTPVFLGADVRL